MIKIQYLVDCNGADRFGTCMGYGDNMNGKWISCDDLLPSPSHKGFHGFVLCCTGNQIEWGRYTSYGWYKIDGMPMDVSAWYDANYTGLIQGILNVQV